MAERWFVSCLVLVLVVAAEDRGVSAAAAGDRRSTAADGSPAAAPGDDAAAAGGPPHAGFTIQEGFEGFLVPQWKFGGAPTVGAAVGGVLGGLAAGKILTTLPFFLLLKPALKLKMLAVVKLKLLKLVKKLKPKPSADGKPEDDLQKWLKLVLSKLSLKKKSHLKSAMKKLALYLKKTMDAKLPVPALAVPVKAVPRVEKPVVGQAVTSADTKQASSLEVHQLVEAEPADNDVRSVERSADSQPMALLASRVLRHIQHFAQLHDRERRTSQ